MLKKDKTTPFRIISSGDTTDPESPTNPTDSTGPTAEDMLMNCAVSKLKADRTPIPDNRFTLPPEYGVDGGGSSDAFNGHEYVDLGLPSGTLWAKMNVGANSETDYGLYFAWGETQGYTASQVGNGEGQKAFSWSDYKWTEDDGDTMSKYNATDGKTILDLEDDAAAANMGGDWHMPTKEQCDELFNTEYVTNAWVENYQDSGIGGSLFTSVSNGNTLFIPAAGNCTDGEINGGVGVWSSSLYTDNVNNAQDFFSIPFDAKVSFDHRYGGLSVRSVVGQMDEITDETTPGGGGESGPIR